jgi:hypothetical protein
MVIIDLKGDEVLFQTAKAEAAKRGQKFRFFTLEPGKATFRFNPFSGFRSERSFLFIWQSTRPSNAFVKTLDLLTYQRFKG